MRICIIGEDLIGRRDEGIRTFALKLIDELSDENDVMGIHVSKDKTVYLPNRIEKIQSNRLFLNKKLYIFLRKYDPELVIYISPSCGKISALFRLKIIKKYVPNAKTFIVILQHGEYNLFEKMILPILIPDHIFVQSSLDLKQFEFIKKHISFLPSGVDTDHFRPISKDAKNSLRKKYSIEQNAFVALHVGHSNRNRNVQLLGEFSILNEVEVIFVGSTSTPKDEALAKRLIRAGIRVIHEYVPNIVELYQISDVYIFPSTSDNSSIGVPLSVLEAMSCNLPVITTRFGGLPLMFDEGNGFFFFQNKEELKKIIAKVKGLEHCSTRSMIEAYDWRSIAKLVVKKADEADYNL